MSTQHRLTVIVDNFACHSWLGNEHGLSIHIHLASGQRWLWDTGQTGLLLANAAQLGLDLAACSGVALSHGHYDHTGGLRPLLAETTFSGPIVGHPDLGRERFAVRKGQPVRSIGLPSGTRLPNFSPAQRTTQLAPGLYFVSDIERDPKRFEATEGFFLDRQGQVPDSVPDDACLVLETAVGPVIILGCCHSGLANSLQAISDRLGPGPFQAVLGGMHLNTAPDWARTESLEVLQGYGVQWIAPGHCTGEAASADLARRFPGQTLPFAAGSVFDLPA